MEPGDKIRLTKDLSWIGANRDGLHEGKEGILKCEEIPKTEYFPRSWRISFPDGEACAFEDEMEKVEQE